MGRCERGRRVKLSDDSQENQTKTTRTTCEPITQLKCYLQKVALEMLILQLRRYFIITQLN